MLWSSVYLPELSLQAHARGALGHMHDVPLVISDGVVSRPHVHAANACARAVGITIAMPVAAAQARAAQLLVVPRMPEKEQTRTQTITVFAKPASSFTFPSVACLPTTGLVQFTYNGSLSAGQTYLWNFVARALHFGEFK